MFCDQCGAQLPEGSRFCNSCGTNVSGGTPTLVHPTAPPQRSSGFRKFLKWAGIGVGGVIVLFVVLAIFVPNPEDSSPAASTVDNPAQIATPSPTATPEPVQDVNIREMLDLHESNEVAAEAEYKGKLVRTRGLIENIKEDGFKLLPLDSDDFQMSGAECKLVKSQRDLIVNLRTGDAVIVTGRHGGFSQFFTTTAKIHNCSIVNR